MARVGTGWIGMCGAGLAAVMGLACSRQPSRPTPAGPMVNFVSPSFALAGVSTAIQIHGLGFQPGATVRIDGVGVTATVETPLRIAATAPPHELGDVEIVVTNPDGSAARLPRGLKYITAHQIPGGGDLRIRPGESITSTLDSLCTFDGVPCRRLVLDAAPQETIELEVSSLEPAHPVGLFATEPTREPDSYPAPAVYRESSTSCRVPNLELTITGR